jgi:hypothetical protein
MNKGPKQEKTGNRILLIIDMRNPGWSKGWRPNWD